MQNNICVDVFKNLSIHLDKGVLNLSTCCIAKHDKTDVINFYDNSFLNSIRQSWYYEVSPPACIECKKAEDNNLLSRRKSSNEWYKDHNLYNTEVELIRLDFWTGDLCNLACCICGPGNSSVWKQELKFPIENKKVKTNNTWRLLDLSKIQFIHFNGGEPLLNKEHIELLEAIPNKSTVHINYNTNGTILPSNKLLKLWSKFKLVRIDFSIDDVGNRFEYQRFPAKWSNVTNNLKWFYDNCDVNTMFAVNTTVSILNVGNLHNLDAWLLENFKSNRTGDPVEYRKQSVIGFLTLDGISNRKEEVVNFLNACDSRRGTNWQSTLPELVELL